MIDDELAPDIRALLAAGRDRLGPDAATIARLRTRIDTSVAAPSIAHGIAIKLVVVAAIATVGAGVYRFERGATAPSAPSIASVSEQLEVSVDVAVAAREPAAPTAPQPPVAPAPIAASSVVPVPVATSPVATSSVATSPVTTTPVATSPVATSPVTTTPVVAAPSPPAGISLAREIELVDRASLGMRGGDLTLALDVLHLYDRETEGRGQLAQDAAALEVEVLCRRRDHDATAALTSFQRRWPKSAHRSHLTATCRETSNASHLDSD